MLHIKGNNTFQKINRKEIKKTKLHVLRVLEKLKKEHTHMTNEIAKVFFVSVLVEFRRITTE